jgi:cell division protein FtsB
MEEFFTIISNFGFPITVAVYLLFRFEKKLEQLEKTNATLIVKISELEKEIKELKEEIVFLLKK